MVTSADAVLPLCLAIDSSLQSRETSSRHLAAIQAFFHSFQRSPLRPAAPGEAPENGKRQLRVKFGAGAKRGRDGKPIESLDNPNQHALMDAAMVSTMPPYSIRSLLHHPLLQPTLLSATQVLRDPSSLYLILHEIHRSLLSAASSLAPAPSHPPSHHTPLVAPWDPWASTRLLFLTQLAQLALNAREMLREGRAVYMNPDADVVTQGYPALVALLGRVARGVDAGHWHGGLQAESSGGEAGFASGLAR